MLRTKDLVLFVLVIAFLMIAIMFTVVSKPSTSSEQTEKVIFNEITAEDKVAIHDLDELDRASNIARLRDAINSDESISTYTASEEVDGEPIDETTTNLKCPQTGNPIAFLRSWPRDKVEVGVVEGARLVAEVAESMPMVPKATTSTSSNKADVVKKETKPLLVLPLLPIPTAETNCVSNEIVGITAQGGLLFNSDAAAYVNKNPDSLIGYARDGYPVYGPYTGQVDECGGYTAAGGYRYAINSIDKKVLGCYRATPQNFVGE